MGLDISGYKNLVEVATLEPDDDSYDEMRDTHNVFYVNPAFPGREEGIKPHTFYSGDRLDGPSMGYGGYGVWRNKLAELAGYKNAQYEYTPGFTRWSYCTECWFDGKTGPFSEQINFSDCEGVLGPVVCAKLAKDYNDFDEQAKLMGTYFYETYAKFKYLFNQTEGLVAVGFH